jgi:hypothetical protein
MRDFDVADAPLDRQLLALEAALATNAVVAAILQRVPLLSSCPAGIWVPAP